MPVTPAGGVALVERLAAILAAVRDRGPVVHHLTNMVTAADVANVTLALGAHPVMAVAAEEVGEVVARADALVVNMGTPAAGRLRVIETAARLARAGRIPIVLDPVAVGISRFRQEAADRLVSAGVTIVRGNGAEVAWFARRQARLRGVDAEPLEAPEEIARRAAALTHTVVALTGETDYVTDGQDLVAVRNGHPWLRKMTGAGCMATAAIGCCAAVTDRALDAAVAGLVIFGVAAEAAAQRASGPGTLRPALLDALATIEPETLRRRARVTEVVPR